MISRILCLAMMIFLFFGYAYAESHSIPSGQKCDECGMNIDQNSNLISQVITKDDKKLFFCDVGDMLYHFKLHQKDIKFVYVRDFVTGEWIDGKTAMYVMNKKFNSPMSWNIASFNKDSDAKKWGSPVDFNKAFTLPK